MVRLNLKVQFQGQRVHFMPIPGGRAVWGVFPQTLDSWDCRFESRWVRGFSYLVLVVCCEGSGLCEEPIAGLEESHQVCVRVCVRYRNLNNDAV